MIVPDSEQAHPYGFRWGSGGCPELGARVVQDLPIIWAQVVHAVREEQGRQVEAYLREIRSMRPE